MATTNTLPAQADRPNPLPLKQEVARMRDEFGKALPGHISADKFVRTIQTAISLTRNIEKVKDPQSLLAACTKAAADGLILDGREAALVVDFNGDVQYRPMMRGLLKLAYNSGALKSLVVEPVRENDVFVFSPTNANEPIKHEIDLKKPRGEAYAFYAKAELKDGGIVFEVMTKEDVHRIRDRSDAWKAFKANKIKSTPWSTDEMEMARKTVFRRLSKYLPSSSDRDTLHQAAERIDEDYTFEIDAEPAGSNVTHLPATKKRGGAAAALKDVTPKAIEQDRPAEPVKAEPRQQAKAKPESSRPQFDERNPPPFDPETGVILDHDDDDAPKPGDDI